ncbi:MAG: hypothetical protein LBF60_06420 [Treponema sp.]|jgi:hypothetical protein|nr:hypothetical protein [Treponema sp.]
MPSIAQLLPLLGEDCERKCIELGIIRRAREIKTSADLMTLCLFYPLNGAPLAAVSAVAFALKIGNFSDAAFMKKFAMRRMVQTDKRGLGAQRVNRVSEP